VPFTDGATFGANGITYFHNQNKWTDEKQHGKIHAKHQQMFVMWSGIVGDFLVGPRALTQHLTGNFFREFLS
jgi:hypothetical protein